jgi:hypothetical protein
VGFFAQLSSSFKNISLLHVFKETVLTFIACSDMSLRRQMSHAYLEFVLGGLFNGAPVCAPSIPSGKN